jgi:hypothetical protein
MAEYLNLIDEALNHFNEGAKSVRAHTNNTTYIITRIADQDGFWITTEEPGFPKTKVAAIDSYFKDVFGIEAKY